MLQAEGAVLLGVAVTASAQTPAGWVLFAALFLMPDRKMLGYLCNPRVGAFTDNPRHSTLGPLAFYLWGWLYASLTWAFGLIWLGHIGFDRALGYGPKFGDAFKHTHLSGQAATIQGSA